MTSILKSSSELAQSADLIGQLLSPVPKSLQQHVYDKLSSSLESFEQGPSSPVADEQPFRENPQEEASHVKKAVRTPVDYVETDELESSLFTGDKLEKLLADLCTKSGFTSVVVADERGFPISGVNMPVALELLAAFSSVLGWVIDKTPVFFEEYEAGIVSVDISHIEKAVAKKFSLEEQAMYLLIICSQDIDVRSHADLFIDRITRVLER